MEGGVGVGHRWYGLEERQSAMERQRSSWRERARVFVSRHELQRLVRGGIWKSGRTVHGRGVSWALGTDARWRLQRSSDYAFDGEVLG
jgi:hypothetical protein